MVIPNCAFMSNSSNWIMRSLFTYGMPVTLGMRTCVAVLHLGGRQVKARAKLIMSR